MQALAVLCSLALICFASPVVQQQAASELARTVYAIDLSEPFPTSARSCLSFYQTIFVRGYSPAGQGQLDPYACNTIWDASTAGWGTEVYITPQPNSNKSGAQQLGEMVGGLRNCGLGVRSVWIQVTLPINWYTSTWTNINFLNSILARASRGGLSIGIYTSLYDWDQITGGAKINNAMLWYWNVYGQGPNAQSAANFNDFRPFGGWTAPQFKQIGQNESICGVTANRDIYIVSETAKFAGMANCEKSEQIVVGSLGLGSVVPGKVEIKR
ncbi:hypothetical protein ANCDUO_17657 [Ancylostoma duodenale]|uniref:Glycosyl hydrolase family 25 n=1 Tax=Ancylostoma duodenale TaxID=51022 RepID=A0A0C2C7H0_9BILA|nr:hypothetical protein ANCDUO_17657 [Ancylostoma duodenale]